jgi:predicted lipid-binding transport protein (Tim44 family)
MSFSRLIALILTLVAGFAIVAADVADARSGGGRSFGSRASRTYMAPPPTNTAPKAAPVERSMTPKSAPANAQPSAAAPQPSRFGGWRGLLMGGLFAAGLASIFGFGALASVLGFLLQFALIAGIAYLVLMLLRSRSQPAFGRAAAQGPDAAAQGPDRAPQRDTLRQNNQARDSAASALASEPALTIGQEDLGSFERLLGEIQTAYGREDADKLAAMTTPEMLSYFSQEFSDNAKRGLRNEVSDVKLLQGDLSEAWRDNGSDYATVAMRYSLNDAMVERATGRVVSGDRTRPTEATEFWTFRRDDRAPADGWQLSAIQQAA